jgi:peptide chain release factor 2
MDRRFQKVVSVVDDTGVLFEFFQAGDATEAEMLEQYKAAIKATKSWSSKIC